MDVEIPYTNTGPATTNILAPTPITYPSLLNSIAGETIEFAKARYWHNGTGACISSYVIINIKPGLKVLL